MADTSPALSRTALLQRLRDHPQWDVLVIGGGATGLGCALDAVTRGYSVLLLEAGDFGRGTSSRSTKLIHGGVRYLAQGRIHLVREALLERARLLRNAPHLVKPMRFVVPAHSRLEQAKFALGLTLYDVLAGRHGIQPCRVLDAAATRQAVPNIAPQGLSGGVAYWDAQFDDARLVISLMRSVFEHGGLALNYLPVTALLKENGKVVGVQARDVGTGECFALDARVLINATGVWVDTLRQLETPQHHIPLRPSQGVHLVVDRSFLPGEDGLLVPQTRDGRLLFVIPWQGRVLLGTTDTPRDDAPFEPGPLPGEIDFILETASGYLTKAPGVLDVKSVFCGLRPLVGDSSAASTARLSREHRIERSVGGMFSIMGGKWTTYRRMAEDMLDRVAEDGVLPKRQCVTQDLRLHGADAAGADPSSHAALPGVGEHAGGFLPSVGDVRYSARHELAFGIEDVLARRHRALLLDAAAALEAAPAVARILAEELGWKADRIDAELRAFGTVARGMMTRTLAGPTPRSGGSGR